MTLTESTGANGREGELVNRFLSHLVSRRSRWRRCGAYAYDLQNFLRFLAKRRARLGELVATDLFDYLE